MSDELVAGLQRAADLIQAGDFESAISLAREALQADPSSVDAYSILGMAQSRAGLAVEAEVSLRRAADLQPGAKAYYNLASHLFAAGDRLASEEFAKRALAADPSHEAAGALMARLEAERGTPHQPPAQFTIPPKTIEPPKPFAFIHSLGWSWTLAGCFLAGASVISRILLMVRIGSSAPANLEGMTESQQMQWATRILTENAPLLVGAFVWLALLAAWWVIDYAHWQRRNLLFYVILGVLDATVLFCCTYGVLHCGLFAVYLLLSRRPPSYPPTQNLR